MPRTTPRKTESVNLRLTPQHLAAVDQLAADLGEPRAGALRLVVRTGLATLGAMAPTRG